MPGQAHYCPATSRTVVIFFIRALIEQYPKESRRKLSVRSCEAWQWRQANGALRDMVCRGMLRRSPLRW